MPRLGCIIFIVGSLLVGCREVGPTPTPNVPSLIIEFEEPVTARFVPEAEIFVAQFPVTIADPRGPGGTLLFLEVTVLNRSRNIVVAKNRRPNSDFTFTDRTVPAGGRLVVEAGIGFPPPPPRDEVVAVVRATLTNGRAVEKTSALASRF